MDANKLFQGFCENILKPIIQEAVSEALPPHLETATSAKKYYTVQQAAEIANVDISTIYRWKGKGTLTFLYIEAEPSSAQKNSMPRSKQRNSCAINTAFQNSIIINP